MKHLRNNLETTITSKGSLKTLNMQLSKADIIDYTATAIPFCDRITYSRSKLFDLRNGSAASPRLEPIIQAKLKSLGIWKSNTYVKPCQNSAIISCEGISLYGTVDSQVHVTLTTTNASRQSPASSLYNTYVDQRSISSSHLMPAFAKRKSSTYSKNTSLANGISSVPLRCIEAFPFNTQSQMVANSKDEIWYSNATEKSNFPLRQADEINLNQHRYNTYLNDSEEGANDDRRDQELLPSNDNLSSTRVFKSYQNNINVPHERRIGSGRLISRETNWDYRTIYDSGKSRSSKFASLTENSVPTPNRCGQFLAKHLDRSISARVNLEQQSHCHRGGAVVEDLKNKYERAYNTQSSSLSITGEDIYGSQSSSLHTSSRNRNTHNNRYRGRNEEPEWLSGGPKSQHDTIELRGFEEDELNNIAFNTYSKTHPSILVLSGPISEEPLSCASSTLCFDNTKSEEQLCTVGQEKEVNTSFNISPNTLESIKEAIDHDKMNNVVEKYSSLLQRSSDRSHDNIADKSVLPQFNIDKLSRIVGNQQESTSTVKMSTNQSDVFLNPNLDPLTHSLMRGDSIIGNESKALGNSRFSRWFGNQNGEIKVNQFTTPANDSFVTPEIMHKSAIKPNTLKEFLNTMPLLLDSKTSQKASSITSVEELEASLRAISTVGQASSNNSTPKSNINKIEKKCGQPQDLEAFKKLLQQLEYGYREYQQQSSQFQQSLPENALQRNLGNDLNIKTHKTMGEQVNQLTITYKGNYNNSDIAKETLPHPNRMHLPFIFSNPQNRIESQNLRPGILHNDIPIHPLEQEMYNSKTSTLVKEVMGSSLQDKVDIGDCYYIKQNTKLNSSTAEHQRPQSPLLLCRNDVMATSNQISLPARDQDLQPNIHFNVIPPEHFRYHLNSQTNPSERKLQLQTQTIIHELLIKNIEKELLKEQRNGKKRQEVETRLQPNTIKTMLTGREMQIKKLPLGEDGNCNHRQLISRKQKSQFQFSMQQQLRHYSSTQLAFTPTSVLRKMTAEKDSVNKSLSNQCDLNCDIGQQNKFDLINSETRPHQMAQHSITTQPRVILGGHLSQRQQKTNTIDIPSLGLSHISQQQYIPTFRNTFETFKNPLHVWSQNMTITKPLGRPILKGYSTHQSNWQQNESQMETAEVMYSKVDQIKQIPDQQLTNSTSTYAPFLHYAIASESMPSNGIVMTQVKLPHLYQQHALALQRHQNQQFLQPNHQQEVAVSMNNTDSDNNDIKSKVDYSQDGTLSPTCNKLARWFSPELLAQATAGKLPILNISQTWNLKEFEKHILHPSTAVHN